MVSHIRAMRTKRLGEWRKRSLSILPLAALTVTKGRIKVALDVCIVRFRFVLTTELARLCRSEKRPGRLIAHGR